MITKLTKEQEAKIESYQKKWSDAFFKNDFDNPPIPNSAFLACPGGEI